MRRSGRLWFYRTLPLLAVGILGIMLLVPGDGSPKTAALALAAAAPKPAIQLASAPNATPATFKLASHEIATTDAPALDAPAAAQPVLASPPWPQLAAATADTTLAPGKVGDVAVNMRASPSSSADKLSVLSPGEAVQIGETSGGWTRVERADGEGGWVYSRFLASPAGATPVADAAPPVAKAQRPEPAAANPDTSDDLVGRYARLQGPTPVRSAPAAYAAAVVVLDSGERVRISQTRGRWLRIVTADGISGWIPT